MKVFSPTAIFLKGPIDFILLLFNTFGISEDS